MHVPAPLVDLARLQATLLSQLPDLGFGPVVSLAPLLQQITVLGLVFAQTVLLARQGGGATLRVLVFGWGSSLNYRKIFVISDSVQVVRSGCFLVY